MIKKYYPHTFSPIRIGNKVAKNRIQLAPMTHIMATRDGRLTTELIAMYKDIAKGGAGIVTVGESAVDFEHGSGHAFQINLGSDAVHADLCRLTEAIKRYGALASIEINHEGNQIVHSGVEPISASPLIATREEEAAKREGRRRVPVTKMDQTMIDDVIENFAIAAERCYKAGFDMIMVHGGHGHLLSQFLSPLVNKRDDGYGGSLKNRAKFSIEVLDAIRERVGDDMAIELRISADELIEGGLRLDEMIEYAKMIEDKIDLLHVSVGVLADHNVMLRMEPAIYYEHGINVHYATEIRKHVSIPVVTIGGITDIEMIEDIIANDKADVVSLARALLADHELPNKARKGRAEDIRPCTRCVTCMRLTGEHVHPLRCGVNPIAGRELEFSYIPDAKEPKNIVVVGGGPAGMEAAIVASDRGHKVTLFEQNEELGGMLNHAAVLPFKDDTLRFRNWLVNQTLKRKDKIDIRLGVKATPDMVSEMEPDAVVVALGAEPIRPRIPAEDPSMVVDALEVDAGKIEVGDRVVVAGGGITGLECGLNLAQNGKDVTIIDMIPKSEFGKEGPRGTVYFLEQAGAKFVTEVKLMRVTKEGAVVQDRNWNEFVIPCDTVICAFGLKSRRKEAEEFKDVAYDVFYVGDVKEVHDIRRAIHSAFNLMVDYE